MKMYCYQSSEKCFCRINERRKVIQVLPIMSDFKLEAVLPGMTLASTSHDIISFRPKDNLDYHQHCGHISDSLADVGIVTMICRYSATQGLGREE